MNKVYLVWYNCYEDNGEPYGEGILAAYATREAAVKAIHDLTYITLEYDEQYDQYHAVEERADMEGSVIDAYYTILEMLVKE